MNPPDLVITNKGKEQARIGCGCIVLVLLVIFAALYLVGGC